MEKRLNHLKEKLVYAVEDQLANIDTADTKELGEAIDMIKDLEEAIYYCTITKSMEEASKKEKEGHNETIHYYSEKYIPMEPYMPNIPPMYYRDMDRPNGRMYYDGGNGGSGNSGSGMGGNGGTRSYYDRYRMDMMGANPDRMRKDEREGRSPERRRSYMEGQSMNKDKVHQMQELNKYMQELATDMTEMIEKASPEEKQLLHQKITELAGKIK